LSPLPLLHQSAFSAIAAYALKRYDASCRGAIDVAAAKQCLQASTIAFYLLGHFYASYRQLTISINSLLLRGYHASHPPMHRYLPLWLSLQLQHMICVVCD